MPSRFKSDTPTWFCPPHISQKPYAWSWLGTQLITIVLRDDLFETPCINALMSSVAVGKRPKSTFLDNKITTKAFCPFPHTPKTTTIISIPPTIMKYIRIISGVVVALAGQAHSQQQQNCPSIRIFGARETTAPPGLGSASTVVNLIQQANNGSTSESIVYPAAGGNAYGASVTAGVAAVANQTSVFNLACPDTRIVVVGYSQVSWAHYPTNLFGWVPRYV